MNPVFHNLPEDVHYCTSERQGDWLIWKCPFCSDPSSKFYTSYERKLNFFTGEMKIRGRSEFQHTGAHDGNSTKNVSEPLIKNLSHSSN